MRDTLLTYKNIICQKILTVRLEDGKMSNKDTQQLSQNLFIGFLCLKCPTLREKVYWICLIYVIYSMCYTLPFILINPQPTFLSCADGDSLSLFG